MNVFRYEGLLTVIEDSILQHLRVVRDWKGDEWLRSCERDSDMPELPPINKMPCYRLREGPYSVVNTSQQRSETRGYGQIRGTLIYQWEGSGFGPSNGDTTVVTRTMYARRQAEHLRASLRFPSPSNLDIEATAQSYPDPGASLFGFVPARWWGFGDQMRISQSGPDVLSVEHVRSVMIAGKEVPLDNNLDAFQWATSVWWANNHVELLSTT